MKSSLLDSWWSRLAKAVFVLSVTWLGFLYLICNRPVDAGDALIMAWLSALVLILACLPEIFAVFKSFKWGDFEVELRDTLLEAESQLCTIQNLDDRSIFTLERGMGELANLVKRLATRQETPVLMKIDLGKRASVSWPVLYTYVFVMETMGTPVRLLFLASDANSGSPSEGDGRSPNSFRVSCVLGVLSGRRFLIACHGRWPALRFVPLAGGGLAGEGLETKFAGWHPGSSMFKAFCTRIRSAIEQETENSSFTINLDLDDFREWLAEESERLIVDIKLGPEDVGVIEKGLLQNRKFLVLRSRGDFHSVVALSTVTRYLTLANLGRINERLSPPSKGASEER